MSLFPLNDDDVIMKEDGSDTETSDDATTGMMGGFGATDDDKENMDEDEDVDGEVDEDEDEDEDEKDEDDM